MPTLPCPANRGPLLPVSICASSSAAAEGLVASFTLMAFKCADGCKQYANATATLIGPCPYDADIKEYKVTVTSYGCEKVKDAEKIVKQISEQIEGERKK